MLEDLATGGGGDSRHLEGEEFLLLELERSRTELASSLVLLRVAEDRVVELEGEVRTLRATVDYTAVLADFSQDDGPPKPWYRPSDTLIL